jgi:hypothetical protein
VDRRFAGSYRDRDTELGFLWFVRFNFTRWLAGCWDSGLLSAGPWGAASIGRTTGRAPGGWHNYSASVTMGTSGTVVSAFRDRGVTEPTSECRRVPQPRWVERESEREGGRARQPETGVREVGIPRPSCSSRAQVGCACSRGLQASTRERERAASSERLSRPRPRAANLL